MAEPQAGRKRQRDGPAVAVRPDLEAQESAAQAFAVDHPGDRAHDAGSRCEAEPNAVFDELASAGMLRQSRQQLAAPFAELSCDNVQTTWRSPGPPLDFAVNEPCDQMAEVVTNRAHALERLRPLDRRLPLDQLHAGDHRTALSAAHGHSTRAPPAAHR